MSSLEIIIPLFIMCMLFSLFYSIYVVLNEEKEYHVQWNLLNIILYIIFFMLIVTETIKLP